jgi:hypothetical protein
MLSWCSSNFCILLVETVKTRMQVQGELAKAGAPQPYRNAFQAFASIAKNEGWSGLQGGTFINCFCFFQRGHQIHLLLYSKQQV